MKEKTIQHKIILKGKTLYSNKNITMCLYPLPAHSGIIINNKPINIEYLYEDSNYFTTVSGIKLTEHLLSALYYLGINNLYIELEEDEIPIFDGAAQYFIDNLKPVIKEFDYEQEVYIIKKSFEYEINTNFYRCIKVKEGSFSINAIVDFPYAGKQEFVLSDINDYETYIAKYKTFANKELYEYYKKNYNLYNSEMMFVFDKNTQFEGTELAKHKILDIIGDLYLLNKRIIGNIYAYKSGHKIHHQLIKKIYNDYKIKKMNDINKNIKEITLNAALNIIEKKKLRPYYNLDNFSFELNLYDKIFILIENQFTYIYTNNFSKHALCTYPSLIDMPLCVYTDYHKKDSNYLPFNIKLIKNCILYRPYHII